MDYPQITVNAALIGAFISIILQALKLLPAKWLQKILTDDQTKQKMRMRAIVLGSTFVAVMATGAHIGAFTWSGWYNLAYMFIIALTSSYSVYQTVVSMIADKFPEYFTLSE